MAKVSLEDYLSGRPLNERLAKLASGEREEQTAEAEGAGSIHLVAAGGLDDNEREHLRQLTFEPGWLILLNLLDKVIQEKENQTRRNSKVNPLENATALAGEWARLGNWEEFRRLIVSTVDAEIQKLKGKEDEASDGEILG